MRRLFRKDRPASGTVIVLKEDTGEASFAAMPSEPLPPEEGSRVPLRAVRPAHDGEEPLYAQALDHYRQQEWEEARECLLRLKEIHPTDPAVDALLKDLDLFVQPGSTRAKARQAVARPVVETSPGSGSQRRATRHPRRRRRLVLLLLLVLMSAATLLIYSGRVPLPTLPSFSVSPAVRDAQRYTNQGRAFLVVDQYKEAIGSFSKALELDPDNSEAKAGLQRARDYLQLSVWYEEATTLMAQNTYDLALSKLEAITAVDPWYKDANILLARCQRYQELDRLYAEGTEYYDASEWVKATNSFETLMQKDPAYRRDEVKSKLFDSYLNDGRQRIAKASNSLDVIRAGVSFDKALSLFPADAAAEEEEELASLYSNSYVAYTQGNWRQAISTLSRIYGVRPDYAGGNAAALLCTCYLKLGGTYRASGELQLALEQYRAVLSISSCEQTEAQSKLEETLVLLPTPTPTRKR